MIIIIITILVIIIKIIIIIFVVVVSRGGHGLLVELSVAVYGGTGGEAGLCVGRILLYRGRSHAKVQFTGRRLEIRFHVQGNAQFFVEERFSRSFAQMNTCGFAASFAQIAALFKFDATFPARNTVVYSRRHYQRSRRGRGRGKEDAVVADAGSVFYFYLLVIHVVLGVRSVADLHVEAVTRTY